jgi:hypothetical protein
MIHEKMVLCLLFTGKICANDDAHLWQHVRLLPHPNDQLYNHVSLKMDGC